MFFSKSCVYGIRSVLYLTLENQRHYISIKEISERLNISFHFLTKILQTLTQQGLVESFKGPKGGVMLLKSPDHISLLDIILILDGPDLFKQCILGLPGCGESVPCPLHDTWDEQRENMKNIFQSTSLSGLAEKIKSEDLRLFDPLKM
jgi:Rrf2 family protein